MSSRSTIPLLCVFLTILLGLPSLALAWGEAAAVDTSLTDLPVREVTVFKDGHAYVLHEGELLTDENGDVLLESLPAPVLGTFWPYASGKASLASVVASRRRVQVEKVALSLTEFLLANIGAEGIFAETTGQSYRARLLAIPQLRIEDAATTLIGTVSFNGAQPLVQHGQIVLLETETGVRAVQMNRIRDVTFLGGHRDKYVAEEMRDILTLDLDWPEGAPEKSATVGLMYLQRGLRWIPSYKVILDGEGRALVKLQATLINELVDLEDVTVNLVIGVPSIVFKDTVDPMALQDSLARLSPYFDQQTQTAGAFTNGIMTQTARMGEYRARAARPGASGEANSLDSEKSEDLFIFKVKNVSLKKNARMVLPVAEFPLKYRDVFTLDIPFAPPAEVRKNFGTEQQRQLARLFSAPKAMHQIRLTNDSDYPLTTAPALILLGDRVLAQGMMTYTSVGGISDLTVTKAIDIRVERREEEARRVESDKKWGSQKLFRVDVDGEILLTNFQNKPVEIEVRRSVLGIADTADQDGKIVRSTVFDRAEREAAGYPAWWNWYTWPTWWHHFNGLHEVRWKLTLEPGKCEHLKYTWHYFWR